MEAATKIPEEIEALAAEIVDTARMSIERTEAIHYIAYSLEPLHEHIENLKKRATPIPSEKLDQIDIELRIVADAEQRLGSRLGETTIRDAIDAIRSLRVELAQRDERIAAAQSALDDLKNGMAELSIAMDYFRSQGFV